MKSLLGVTACIAILLAAIAWLLPGVTVRIRNTGKLAMNDVHVHVSGQTYTIGNIEGLAMKSCSVRPVGESDVDISYLLPDGSSRSHSIDCYIESGSRGTIEVEIADGEMVQSSDETLY